MRNRSRRKSGIGIISILVLCICGIVVFKGIELNRRNIFAQEQINDLETSIREQEELAKDISNYSAYIETKRYIEDIARDKLGLVYEDEILIKPQE